MNISFDDVLIKPTFSWIRSRKEVDLSVALGAGALSLPVISSNMDTVTGVPMANAMLKYGAGACLHRFCSIDDNVAAFTQVKAGKPWVSIGIGPEEQERAYALIEAGAETVVVDVAHGASIGVVEQLQFLREKFRDNINIIVGNFADAASIRAFMFHSARRPNAYKIGIGGGSACLTRVVTGCGMPTLASIIDCATAGVPLIADGGIRNSGDLAKAIAAGASGAFLGNLLAGTDESPGDIVVDGAAKYKKYRGSASMESYEVQGKVADWRAAEGDAYLVPYKGPVSGVLRELEGGLRSALSYVGARNIEDFQKEAEFIRVSTASIRENGAHGKSR